MTRGERTMTRGVQTPPPAGAVARSLDVRAARGQIIAAAARHHRPGTLPGLAARFTTWDPGILAQAIDDAQQAGLLTIGPDGALILAKDPPA